MPHPMFAHQAPEATPAAPEPVATSLAAPDRRGFIKLAGVGLTLALVPAACSKASEAGARTGTLAQPFLRIEPDGAVVVLSKHLEMGQGVWTGLATLVAEELDADWSKVRVESSPSEVPAYGNLDWGGKVQGTGGSSSIHNSYEQYRKAGATARAMLAAAAARQWKVPVAEIAIANGVISHASGKSAGFGDLAAAAADQPVPQTVALKDAAKFTLIGAASAPRVDSADKVHGRQTFGMDVKLDGMLIAVIARTPRFGGTVKAFDASKAKAVPGVVDVVQVPSGVAVLAKNTWAARQGRDALAVTWDDSKAEKRSSAQFEADYKALASKGGGRSVTAKGDAGKALAGATKVIEADYVFPFLAHAPMEPMSCAGRLVDGKCEMWAGFQIPTVDQGAAAAALGLPPENITLHVLAAGGSFGRRATPTGDFTGELASILKATGGKYPVKLVWTREDDIQGGYYRPYNVHRIRAGLDASGKIVGWDQSFVGQSILAGTPFGAPDGSDPAAYEGHAGEQYDIPNTAVRWIKAESPVSVLWWRSVGHTHSAYSKEVMMDELATAAGKDPLEFRLAHLGKHPRHAAVLKLAAEKAGWGTPLPAGKARGIAVQESFGSFVAQVAEVSMKDGAISVDRVVCAVDCGLAVNTDHVRAQMEGGIGFGLGAALGSAITLTDGKPDQANFDTYSVLRIDRMPKAVEVHILNSGNPPSGVGEPGVPPIAPAVANAVAKLTGKPPRRLPLEA